MHNKRRFALYVSLISLVATLVNSGRVMPSPIWEHSLPQP